MTRTDLLTTAGDVRRALDGAPARPLAPVSPDLAGWKRRTGGLAVCASCAGRIMDRIAGAFRGWEPVWRPDGVRCCSCGSDPLAPDPVLAARQLVAEAAAGTVERTGEALRLSYGIAGEYEGAPASLAKVIATVERLAARRPAVALRLGEALENLRFWHRLETDLEGRAGR